MRINKLEINPELSKKNGFKEFKMDRLSSVVALVGKNGSGKTRILNLIEQNVAEILSTNRFLDTSIVEPPAILLNGINQLNPYKGYLLLEEELNLLKSKDKKSPNIETKKRINELTSDADNILRKLNPNQMNHGQPGGLKDRINRIADGLNLNVVKVQKNYFKRIKYDEIRKLQEAISDPNDEMSSFENLIENLTDNLEYNEFGSIHKSSLKFLKKLPHQLAFDLMECLGDNTKLEKRVSHARYRSFKKIFEDFLGKELTWEIHSTNKKVTDEGVQSVQVGIWKINGRDFDYTEFSEGEKSLFAYALMFFLLEINPSIRLKESIIVVDEPELHLHPDSEIDLINGMRKVVGEKGQLWIATHSLNILSHLNYDEIFMVKDSVISHPSSSIQKSALSELMKLEDRVVKLSTFLTSIADWTYMNFMTQCFVDPEIIEIAKKGDPQVDLFKRAVENCSNNKAKMLLDFGAGKGRLFEQINSDKDFNAKVNYCALEPFQELHPHLKKLGVDNIYGDYKEIEENSFDFIVLCNVLHEIELKDWVKTLNKLIIGLKEDGFLIIIEARSLSKGEKIGNVGYLILDLEELKDLFNLKKEPSSLNHKTSSNDIMCAIIPRKDLKQISKSNVLKAMETLEKNTLDKVIALRDPKISNQINEVYFGRQSAFYSQLHINSKLAQLELKPKKDDYGNFEFTGVIAG
ncbi:MAG: hypothetical protein K0S26_999 [Bacteroidota bacterium]|jgi:predicted ATPase|nr:hypothetical protein [Bacteroidota bacterium]